GRGGGGRWGGGGEVGGRPAGPRPVRALYDELCRITGQRHDPCLLDTFIAAVRYMEGGPKTPWWKFTAERKRTLAAREGGDGWRAARPRSRPLPARCARRSCRPPPPCS